MPAMEQERTDYARMQRVREARERADLSQEDLARLVGVSLKSAQNWENRGVPLRRIGQIAAAISEARPDAAVTAAWLQYGEESGPDDLSARIRGIEVTLRSLISRFDRQFPDQD